MDMGCLFSGLEKYFVKSTAIGRVADSGRCRGGEAELFAALGSEAGRLMAGNLMWSDLDTSVDML